MAVSLTDEDAFLRSLEDISEAFFDGHRDIKVNLSGKSVN